MSNQINSAFIAIVGRPNVGKSTFLNQVIGEKVAITSNKPQTTRHKISGILTKDDMQIVFVDTPGMHSGKVLLNKQIDKLAVSSLSEVDIIIFMVDRIKEAEEEHIIKLLKNTAKPVFLVVNKIDLIEGNHNIDKIILSYINDLNFQGVYPISAKDNKNINYLLKDIKPLLKKGPQYYPANMITDQSDKTTMAEYIREKILYYSEEEVPHATAVIIEKIEVNKKQKTLDVSALIIVERQTQKLILIGSKGSKLKRIGTEARKDINKRFDLKVHLNLWIKVVKDWRNNPTKLKQYGYSDE